MISRFQDSVQLENDLLKVEYTFKNQSFKTNWIENKLSKEVLEFEDSNEFEIRFKNGLVINKHHLTLEKYGVSKSKIRFYFKEYKGILIHYVIEIENKNYFKTSLEINIQADVNEDYIVDEIDVVSLKLRNKVVHHNPILFDKLHDESFYLHLGQPIYFNSFFTANTFPIVKNELNNSHLKFTRYYGKLLRPNCILENSIFGVAQSSHYFKVQQAFFKYLDDVKLPIHPCTQYQLDAKNEKEVIEEIQSVNDYLSNNHIPLINYYTLKNGWQNQYSIFSDEGAHFTHGIKKISEEIIKQGGHLGLQFCLSNGVDFDFLEQSKKGSINRGKINICDYRYIEEVKNKIIDYIQKYDLSYIEIDMRLYSPLQFSSTFYLGGGYRDMYSYTDMHEKYLDMFTELIKMKKNIKFNITTSTSSPFFLKYIHILSNIDDACLFQIPYQSVAEEKLKNFLNLNIDEFKSQVYFDFGKGKVLNTFGKFNNLNQFEIYMQALKWYHRHKNRLINSLIINDSNFYGYYSESQYSKVLVIQNKSNQSQSLNFDFLQEENWIDILNHCKYNFDKEVSLNEIVILENQLESTLKIEKIKLENDQVSIYFNQLLIAKPNLYFNDQKIEYNLDTKMNKIYFKVNEYQNINEIVFNDVNGTKIEYKKFYPNSIILKQDNQYEFIKGIENRLDFSLSCDIEVDTFNRTLVKQKNNLEVRINSAGNVEVILKELRVILTNYKVVVPQKFKLRIDKCANECIEFYIDDQLIQKISIPNLNKIRFTSERLLLADTVSNFKIEEI